VIDQQLAPPPEQVGQPHRPVQAIEDVRLVDLDHRQLPPRGVHRVPLPAQLFLLGQQLHAGSAPLRGVDDFGQVHGHHALTLYGGAPATRKPSSRRPSGRGARRAEAVPAACRHCLGTAVTGAGRVSTVEVRRTFRWQQNGDVVTAGRRSFDLWI
jgi:hypothetical protein